MTETERLVQLIENADRITAAQVALEVALQHEPNEAFAQYLAEEAGPFLEAESARAEEAVKNHRQTPRGGDDGRR